MSFVDVHHHVLFPEYKAALKTVGIEHDLVAGRPFPDWSVDQALEFMGEQGIAAAVASVSAPGVFFGDAGFARDLARTCNELSAQMVRTHGKKFGAFAVLPLPLIEESIDEVAYALDTLHLDGVILLTSVADKYLCHPHYEPLLAELHRRSAVAFIHPNLPPGLAAVREAMGFPWIPGVSELAFDTTRTAIGFAMTGIAERHSNIRFILSHAGGTLPYLAGRLPFADPLLAKVAPKGMRHYVRSFYYDTALSPWPTTFGSLLELVDTTQIVIGTDFPFVRHMGSTSWVTDIPMRERLSDADRARIGHENARGLFPRLAERMRQA